MQTIHTYRIHGKPAAMVLSCNVYNVLNSTRRLREGQLERRDEAEGVKPEGQARTRKLLT